MIDERVVKTDKKWYKVKETESDETRQQKRGRGEDLPRRRRAAPTSPYLSNDTNPLLSSDISLDPDAHRVASFTIIRLCDTNVTSREGAA